MLARSVNVVITYSGKDISSDIAPYLTAFTFTDNSGDKSDDISFTLEDRQGLWLDSWFPSKGSKITCSIVSNDVTAQSLPCGQYEADQIDYSCPPKTITIKGISTAITHSMKTEKHSKAWENTGLRAIASDIANDNGLSLYFKASDTQIERREQILTSDIEFLSALCADYGLEVKVNEGKLIIYDGEQNEGTSSIAEIDSSDTKIIAYRFTSKSAKTYKKAKVKYHHAVKDETFEGEDEDDSVEGTERVLEINEYAESTGDAKAIATKRLYEANKKEVTGTITMMGDMRFRAGSNVTLTGFGAFSGKYTITKATHTVANGYTTALELQEAKATKKSGKTRKTKQQSPSLGYYTGNNYYGKD